MRENLLPALLHTVKQDAIGRQLTHAEQVRATDEAAKFMRVGNFDEAASKGVETVVFGRPLTGVKI